MKVKGTIATHIAVHIRAPTDGILEGFELLEEGGRRGAGEG